MGNPLNSDEWKPHHDVSYLLQQRCFSMRETPTNVQADERERDIGIYGEKESERVRGRGKERETEYECVCTIAVRDPLAFQNRFLAVVTRNAVTPSKYSLDRHQKYESVERQFCITRCVVVSLGWTSREGTPEADRSLTTYGALFQRKVVFQIESTMCVSIAIFRHSRGETK